MDNTSRNVRAIGVWYAFFGLVVAAGSVCMLVAGNEGAITPPVAYGLVAYGAVLLVAGIKLLQFKAWAWWVCAVLTGLSLLASLAGAELFGVLLLGLMLGALMKARSMFFEQKDQTATSPTAPTARE